MTLKRAVVVAATTLALTAGTIGVADAAVPTRDGGGDTVEITGSHYSFRSLFSDGTRSEWFEGGDSDGMSLEPGEIVEVRGNATCETRDAAWRVVRSDRAWFAHHARCSG